MLTCAPLIAGVMEDENNPGFRMNGPELRMRVGMIGTQARYIRRKRGLGQEEIARKAGLEVKEVRLVEERTMEARIPQMVRVMEALGVQSRLSFQTASGDRSFAVELFLEEEDDPEPEKDRIPHS